LTIPIFPVLSVLTMSVTPAGFSKLFANLTVTGSAVSNSSGISTYEKERINYIKTKYKAVNIIN